MIVQVRGIAGAGKSTVVRRLLIERSGAVVDEATFERPNGRGPVRMPLWRCDGDLHVVGRYDLNGTSGAGGDRVSGPVGLAILRHFGRAVNNLVFESLRGSNETPRGERLDLLRELNVTWATLDTPLELCIERIYGRRVERGRNIGASLNEQKLAENYRLMHRYADEAARAGIPCVSLDHTRAFEQLVALLDGGETPLPVATRESGLDFDPLRDLGDPFERL